MTGPGDPLRILQLSVMEGANYYSGGPIVVLRLDLGEYDEVFTNAIDGFFPALKARLPSLQEHHCSPGHPGGFFERVAEGTLLGHVAEHVAIELQTLAGMDVGFGKTRATRVPGVYNVVYRFEDEAAGLEAGRMAVKLVNSILTGGEFDAANAAGRLREMWAARRPAPFTRTILREAKRRRIPVQRMAGSDLLILGTGVRQQRLPNLGAETGPKAARLVMDRLFPEGASSQTRLIGIAGSRGVSRLTERLASFLAASGVNTGWVDGDGRAFFPDWDGVGSSTGENPPRPLASVQRLLREPDLEAAVVAVPPERILRDGLPYDWAEVGVVLNVGDVPAEYDYLHNPDDFAHALCVVPEKVLETGLAVLNADDPQVLKMADRAKGRVILFSANYHNEAMRQHADRGEAAVVLDGDEIVVLRGRERIRLIGGILGDGSADGDPANNAIAQQDREVLLAFVAVLWGLGLVNSLHASVNAILFPFG